MLHEFPLCYIVLILFCNRTINAATLVTSISLCLSNISNIHFNNYILSAKKFHFWGKCLLVVLHHKRENNSSYPPLLYFRSTRYDLTYLHSNRQIMQIRDEDRRLMSIIL